MAQARGFQRPWRWRCRDAVTNFARRLVPIVPTIEQATESTPQQSEPGRLFDYMAKGQRVRDGMRLLLHLQA